MTTSLKLKVATMWPQTFANWGAELRKLKFLTDKDFPNPALWDPIVTTDAGTITYTITLARYWVRYGGIIEFQFGCLGATATAAATEVYFSLPTAYPPDDAVVGYSAFAANIDDNGSGWLGASSYLVSSARVATVRYDRAALTAPAASVKLAVWGRYKL